MKTTFTFLLLTICTSLFAQIPVEWVAVIGNENNDQVYDMTIDNEGNMFITGTYNGIMDINPGPNEQLINSGGAPSMYVQKISSTGELLWHYAINSGTPTAGYGIDVDNQGNVYVVGSFDSVADFDTGAGSSFLVALSISGGYVLKLNSAGQFTWVQGLLGSVGSAAQRIVCDGSNGIYISGLYGGTMDANPGTNTNNLASTGGQDLFIIKLTNAGNYLWSGSIGSDEFQNIVSLVLDNNGDLILSGNFAGNGDFDPSSGTTTLVSIFYSSIFVTKITSTGDFIFAHSFGSGMDDAALTDAATDSENNILLTGNFIETISFDISNENNTIESNGNSDLFLTKLSSDADLLWAYSLGSATSDLIASVTTDGNNDIYFTTTYSLPIDFDFGSDITSLSNASNGNIAVAKYTSNSELIWANGFGGEGNELPKLIRALDEDILYMIGSFSGNAIFSEDENAQQYISAGGEDIFAIRLSCVSYGIQNETACNEYLWQLDGNIYTNSGTYSAVTTNSQGCDSLVTLNLTINTVNDAVTQSGNTLTAVEENANYEWFICGTKNQFLPEENDQSFTATSNGSYGVLISMDGCSVFSDCIAITNIGLTSIEDKIVFIAPNPVENFFYVSAEGIVEEILIFDTHSKIISSKSFQCTNPIVDASTLAKGTYLVQILFADGQQHYTLLIKK